MVMKPRSISKVSLRTLTTTVLQVARRALAVLEPPRRLDDPIDMKILSGDLRGGGSLEDPDGTAIHLDRFPLDRLMLLHRPVHGVVLQKMGEMLRVGQIVERHDLNVARHAGRSTFQHGPVVSRPIRPKPLIPIRTPLILYSFSEG